MLRMNSSMVFLPSGNSAVMTVRTEVLGSPEEKYFKTDRLGHHSSGLIHLTFIGGLFHSPFGLLGCPRSRRVRDGRPRRGPRWPGRAPQAGGVAEEIRPIRMAVTRAWARLAAPSLS